MDEDRAVSEVLGTVLLVGIVIASATAVIAVGDGLVDDSRTRTQLSSAEAQMAAFDASASMVAYGSAERKRVEFGLSTGRIRVQEDAGWIKVVHRNHSAGDDEVVFNETMGAVVYESDAGEVAYQNGGIFRADGSSSVVVSPPEVHHQEQTLTLPLLRIRGSESASGSVDAMVRSRTRNRPVFPNASATYENASTAYENPIADGNVVLVIHSQYYRGWVDYFEHRGVGTVESVDHDDRTVHVRITAGGTYGDFGMPSPGRAVEVTGYEPGHSLDEFELTLEPDGEDDADFANMNWALRASEGGEELLVLFEGQGKVCGSGNVDVTVSYEGPNTSERVWEREDAFTENATAFAYSCAGGTPTLHVNLTGTSELEFVSGEEPAAFDQHSAHGEPTDFHHGDRTSIDHLMNHYLALVGPSVDLTVDDGVSGRGNEADPPGHSASGSVDESASSGTLVYGRSNIVTYLRISENEIAVDLDG